MAQHHIQLRLGFNLDQTNTTPTVHWLVDHIPTPGIKLLLHHFPVFTVAESYIRGGNAGSPQNLLRAELILGQGKC